jgi:hypothetical protein
VQFIVHGAPYEPRFWPLLTQDSVSSIPDGSAPIFLCCLYPRPLRFAVSVLLFQGSTVEFDMHWQESLQLGRERSVFVWRMIGSGACGTDVYAWRVISRCCRKLSSTQARCTGQRLSYIHDGGLGWLRTAWGLLFDFRQPRRGNGSTSSNMICNVVTSSFPFLVTILSSLKTFPTPKQESSRVWVDSVTHGRSKIVDDSIYLLPVFQR